MVQPFFGRESTYPYIPLSTVLTMEKRDLIMTFSNKYVFVGDTSKANHDMVISPVSGVEMP